MTDDYQLRKELDNYKWLFDELTKELSRQGVINISELMDKMYDQSELDGLYSQLDDNLTHLSGNLDTLSTNLKALKNSIIAFNKELIDFDDDNTNLDNDLTKLKDNLHNFLNVSGLLSTDLGELSQSLSTFDEQLNGDGETTFGFVGALQQWDNAVNGTGGFSDQLDVLRGQISALTQGDSTLLASLTTLLPQLEDFEGTVDQFKTELQRVLTPAEYEALDQQIVELLGSIASTKKDISDHKDLLDETTEKIGTPASGNQSATGMYASIDNVNSKATTAKNSADGLTKTLYAGTGSGGAVGSGTTSSPASGSVMANLKQVKDTDVPAVQNILYGDGTVQNPADGSLLGDVYDVDTGLDKAHEHIETIQDMSYGSGTNPSTGQPYDAEHPDPNSLMGRLDSTEEIATEVKETDIPAVQGTLYGGQGYSTGSPSANSVMGKQNEVRSDLYGSNQNPSSAQQGSIKYNANQVPSIQGQIGNVPSGTSIQDQITGISQQIGNMQEGYTFMDTSLNFLFIPSTNFEYVFCFPQTPDNSYGTAKSVYNFPIELITYAYANMGNYSYTEYKRNGSNWVRASIYTSKTIIGVGFGSQVGITDSASFYGNCPFTIFYDVPTKTYLYNYVDPNNNASGYYGTWKAITDYKDFYKYTDIFDAIDNDFTRKGHTHSMSNIDGLTNSLNGKANTSHTHTIANVTNLQTTLNGKANSTHYHNGWSSSELNTYATLYTNLGIGMCHLHYVRSFTSASADQFYTWHTGLIPTDYRPTIQVQGAINQVGSLIVNGNGDILGKFAVGWSSSRTITGDVWWHI